MLFAYNSFDTVYFSARVGILGKQNASINNNYVITNNLISSPKIFFTKYVFFVYTSLRYVISDNCTAFSTHAFIKIT